MSYKLLTLVTLLVFWGCESTQKNQPIINSIPTSKTKEQIETNPQQVDITLHGRKPIHLRAPTYLYDGGEHASQVLQTIWSNLGFAINKCDKLRVYDPYACWNCLDSIGCSIISTLPYDVGIDRGLLALANYYSPYRIYLNKPKPYCFSKHVCHHSGDDFGRYNPRFVKWFIKVFFKSIENEPTRSMMEYHYFNRYRKLAHRLKHVYEKMQSQPVCYNKELKRYKRALKKGNVRLSEFMWSGWMHPNFCTKLANHEYGCINVAPKGENPKNYPCMGYVGGVGSDARALAFWIRRDIDGTKKLWYGALVRFIEMYEPGSPSDTTTR